MPELLHLRGTDRAPWSSSGSPASITGITCGPACTCSTRGSGHYTVRSAPRPRCWRGRPISALPAPLPTPTICVAQLPPLSLCAYLASSRVLTAHVNAVDGRECSRSLDVAPPCCALTLLHHTQPRPFFFRATIPAHPLPSCSLLPTHPSTDFVTFLFFLLFVYISKEYALPHLSLQ